MAGSLGPAGTMLSMDLRQLRHFLTVVDCGSAGRAARRLGISQPALTKSIRSLERMLGAPLFTRSNEGMALNQFGRSLERRARSITIEVDRAEREIRELLGAERGRVVIGT
jgi:DNA-binding transcriptional LysR family regulator